MIKRIGLFVSLTFLVACSSNVLPLNTEQRNSEMNWFFEVFERNYAPLEYKKTSVGLDYQAVKKDCMARANNNQSNDEFRALILECVAKFKDAHTSTEYGGRAAPKSSSVAYLGFLTERRREQIVTGGQLVTRDTFFVTDILPTVKESQFLVKKKDKILKVNGQALLDYSRNEINKYRTTGQSEADFTIAGKIFAMRSSAKMAIPKEDSITLTIDRDNEVFDVTIPWIKKDLYQFEKEQTLAKKLSETSKNVDDSSKGQKKSGLSYIGLLRKNWDALTAGFTAQADIDPLKLIFEKTFRFDMSEFNFEEEAAPGAEKESEKRVFSGAQELPVSTEKEGFKASVLVLQKPTGAVMIGYVRIPSFSITDSHVENFATIVAKFNSMAIKKVIIDTLDNGGGSLVHGMRILSMIKNKPLKYPDMQVALNDNWMESFLNSEAAGSTDSEKEMASRTRRQLDEDVAKGQRLSRRISVQAIDPLFGPFKKAQYLPEDAKVVVLVNEMCASMCDIFAASAKDNGFAQIVGSKAMGAGGNVVEHVWSPIMQMSLRQTESLIVLQDGSFVENNGVKPDVETDTALDKSRNYQLTLKTAIDELQK